jgi:hypothetical protein
MGGEISKAVTAVKTEVVNVVADITGVDPQATRRNYSIIDETMHYSIEQVYHFPCPVTVYDRVIFTWARHTNDPQNLWIYSLGDVVTHAAYPSEYDCQQEINALWDDYNG